MLENCFTPQRNEIESMNIEITMLALPESVANALVITGLKKLVMLFSKMSRF